MRVAGLALVLSWAALFGVGCAQAPKNFDYEKLTEQPVVWPAPPEQSRYRYVGQLTGENNFTQGDSDRVNPAVRFLRFLAGLASGSAQPSVLQRPQAGMSGSDGRIYVADVSRGAVCVFDVPEGKFLVWRSAGESIDFRSPIALVEGPDDEIWVTDSTLRAVVRLSRQGKPLGMVGLGELVHPTGIARDAQRGRVFVADTHAHMIKVFDDAGTLVSTFGRKGEQPGQFNSPTHLNFDQGQLVVSDTLNSRIQVFDAQGNYQRSFGRRGLFLGDLPRPKGVAATQDGLIYVVESYYDHLLVFDAKGQFLLPIGGSGQGVGQFYLPAGVWTDNNNHVYVADMFNGRVVVFEYLGEGDEQS